MTGKQIKALRKRLGITQQELADRISGHQVTVARWETDKITPRGAYLKALQQLAKSGGKRDRSRTKMEGIKNMTKTEKFERVTRRDENGNLVPERHLYRRQNQKANGKWTTRYSAKFVDWQGIRRTFKLGENLNRARAKLQDLHNKNEAEVDFDQLQAGRVARGLTFGKWAAECEPTKAHVDHLNEYFRDRVLVSIGNDDVLKYRAKRSGETMIRHGRASKVIVSQTTINKEVATLRKILRLARAKGIHDKVTAFPMEKEPWRKRTLSAEEYERLKSKCPPWLRRVCIMAYETSLSRGDLLALTAAQIKIDQGIIERDRNKTGAEQAIPIDATPQLRAVVEELLAEFKRLPNTNGLLFTINGQAIDEQVFEYAFKKARKAAQLSNFRFHDLRHCAITRWAAAGIPAAAAMIAAGHKSLQSHKKYQNLQTDQLKAGFLNLSRNCPENYEQKKKSAVS